MPLSGTFDTVALSELLQWFHQTGKSGTLSISVDMEDTYLLLMDGDVAAVGSSDPLRLDTGQLLLAREMISEAQFKDALRQSGPKQTVSESLVANEAINKTRLHQFQSEHLFEMVMDLFFAPQGSFHFSPRSSALGLLGAPEISESNFFVQPISIQAILMESMKRVDEWNRIRQVFPSPLVVVQALPEEGAAGPANPIVRKLTSIGQPISVGDLCLRAGFSRFEAYRQLFEAFDQKRISIDQVPDGSSGQHQLGPVKMLLENARVLMGEAQYDEAWEVLATVANLEPESTEVRDLLLKVKDAQLEQLYQLLPPHRSLKLVMSFEELSKTGFSQREKYLAARLSGQMDVATLVVATPLGELETLRILRKLLHADLVAFVD